MIPSQGGNELIFSIAHAQVDEATKDNLFGAWSEMLVGDKPTGLVDCYLLEDDGTIQIAAVWETAEHHQKAVTGDQSHPGLRVFAACGVDPSHSVFRVVGRTR
jgi:hypothetical protein